MIVNRMRRGIYLHCMICCAPVIPTHSSDAPKVQMCLAYYSTSNHSEKESVDLAPNAS